MRPGIALVRERPDVSVLIAGGGINGVGLLRELALQGVDALLVDKSDFCAGESGAMTRVIHGGLRYLENGEFRPTTSSRAPPRSRSSVARPGPSGRSKTSLAGRRSRAAGAPFSSRPA